MKTTKQVPEGTPSLSTYPHLGEYASGLVVLFTNPNTGFVVYPGSYNTYPIGTYLDNWEMEYHLYQGKIILEN